MKGHLHIRDLEHRQWIRSSYSCRRGAYRTKKAATDCHQRTRFSGVLMRQGSVKKTIGTAKPVDGFQRATLQERVLTNNYNRRASGLGKKANSTGPSLVSLLGYGFFQKSNRRVK